MRGAQGDSSNAIRTDLGAIFVSLELSRSKWVITSLSPGAGEKLSRREVPAGSAGALLDHFAELQRKAQARCGEEFGIIAIQEAGLDGFWLHRVLEREGLESHVVDAASIAVPRRKRRAKTDRIDGEALLRVLLAYKRGEPRVCAMVRPPTPEEEDRRRVTRERQVLIKERIEQVNRIKGLLFAQGIASYQPLRRDRRARLEQLTTGDGRPLPEHLKTQIARALDRLELILEQIKEVEAARDAMLAAERQASVGLDLLCGLKSIGNDFAANLWTEGLSRHFDNRRRLGSYAGFASSPWQSGRINHDQGISKAGNPRLRKMLVQLAWLWTRHQPNSELTKWFNERVKQNNGRFKKRLIVALARKLLVALWKYTTQGVVIEGAVLKPR